MSSHEMASTGGKNSANWTVGNSRAREGYCVYHGAGEGPRAAPHITGTVRTVAATFATVAAVAGLVSVAVVSTDAPDEPRQAGPDERARPLQDADELKRPSAVFVRERLHRANAAFNG
jgi:hypothetical protein